MCHGLLPAQTSAMTSWSKSGSQGTPFPVDVHPVGIVLKEPVGERPLGGEHIVVPRRRRSDPRIASLRPSAAKYTRQSRLPRGGWQGSTATMPVVSVVAGGGESP